MTGSTDDKATVFVVEDEPLVRRAIRVLSESNGLAVKEFESAEEFLEDRDDSIGCIVADIRLKGMSGVDLLEHLEAEGRRRPMVIITGFATTQAVVRAMQHGAVTVLDKPFHENELWEAISRGIDADKSDREKNAQILDLTKRFSELTDQERIVLRLIVGGYINKQISKHLDVSVRTVESRRQQIFKKTGAKNLGELMWQAMLLRAEGVDSFTDLDPETLDSSEPRKIRSFP